MLKRFLYFFIIIAPILGNTQQLLKIVDSQNNEIPFVNYTDQIRKGIGDINGNINISGYNDVVTLSSFGYKDTVISIKNLNSNTVTLSNNAESLNEVTITPGINPALRIIQLASQNRKKNDPNSDLSYQAETYSKFLFSIDSLFDMNAVNIEKDSLYLRLQAARKEKNQTKSKQNNEKEDTIQSNNDTISKFLEQSHLMLMESASIKEFEPPYREKEIITAYKISGLNIPMLANFANSIQSFSFYDNTFDILGSSYLNPIAFGASSKYGYLLEDYIINPNNDTTFIIRFFPDKNKKFDALFGTLYINSNQWAIEKVVAHPLPDKNKMFFVKIVQEYNFIQQKKWFPSNLITEIFAPSVSINGKSLNGKGFTSVSNVTFNPDFKNKKFNSVIVESNANAGELKDEEWEQKRNRPLTEKEENTYVKIDSLSKEVKLERKLNALTYLMQGKIPIKYVNVDLTKVIDFNLYEGYRVGLGLETSNLVSKIVTIGSYFAYGTYDKAWKYGGRLDFLVHRKNNIHINASYHQDVTDRGAMHFDSQPYEFNFNSYYADFYTRYKDIQQDIKLLIYGKVIPNLQLGVSAAFEDIRFAEDYQFINPTPTFVSKLQQINLSTEIIWTPGAKWSLIDNQYFKLKNNLPIFRLKATKTFSKFDYWRFQLDIYQNQKVFRIGSFNYLITATKTIGNAPLFAMNTPNATGGDFNLSVPNSFETMLPGTYYSSQYLALFFRYTTNSWNTKIKFFRPSLGIHQGIGFGDMKNRITHSNRLTFRDMSKGYFETGLIVNKIIYIANIGLGMGVFYHYGKESFKTFEKNLTYKISLLFEIK